MPSPAMSGRSRGPARTARLLADVGRRQQAEAADEARGEVRQHIAGEVRTDDDAESCGSRPDASQARP